MRMQQWKKRVFIFRFIYSLLMQEVEDKTLFLKQLKAQTSEFDYETKQAICQVLIYFWNNKHTLNQKIESRLTSAWSLDRINLMDLAIIYQSLSEQTVLKTDRKIIIDQAIVSAKRYSESNSYKFINSILDKLIPND